MPVQLTGVSGWAGRPDQNGEITPEKSKKSNRGERVENLKSEIEKLDAGVAKGKLIELRNHIDGAPRNGFLRLDGGGRSGDVSFSTHSWKGWGKSAKGEVTGEALRALFKFHPTTNPFFNKKRVLVLAFLCLNRLQRRLLVFNVMHIRV
jgi:hypothetical protein